MSFDDRRRNVRSLLFFLLALLGTVVISVASSVAGTASDADRRRPPLRPDRARPGAAALARGAPRPPEEGAGVSAMARTTGLSRPTIYRVLGSEATSRPARGARRARKAGGGGGKRSATPAESVPE